MLKENLQKVWETVTIWFLLGAAYFVIEGLWRIPQGGYANIAMLPIGGTCGLLIGRLNAANPGRPIFLQAAAGVLITTVVELVAGLIVNVWLGWGLWDYSDLRFNLWGQVCLTFMGLWLLLMPFAIWMDDALRAGLWGQGEAESLLSIYKRFFTLK